MLCYSNGVITYIPTAKVQAEGGYEPNAFHYFLVPSPFPKSVEQRVLSAADRVIEQARVVEQCGASNPGRSSVRQSGRGASSVP